MANNNSRSESYEKAGVDITAGYRAVELMKKHISRTITPGAMPSIGNFGGLFAPDLTGPFCQRGSCMEKQMSCQNPISKLWIPSDILKADYPLLIRREVSSHKD